MASGPAGVCVCVCVCVWVWVGGYLTILHELKLYSLNAGYIHFWNVYNSSGPMGHFPAVSQQSLTVHIYNWRVEHFVYRALQLHMNVCLCFVHMN